MKNHKEIYTPSSLLAIYQNLINIKEEKKLIYMEGLYHKTGSKNYNGFYYDRISDNTNQFLTIKTTNKIRESLNDNEVFSFLGHIDKRIKPNGTIDIIFVSSINQLPEQVEKSEMKNDTGLLKIIKEKLQKPYFDMDHFIKSKLKQNIQLTISLIYGTSSTILFDVYNALGNKRNKFHFNEYQINLSSKDDIINVLSDVTLNSSDIVAFVRGGGEGVKIFDDHNIAATAFKIKPHIISAIGHAENKTLLDSIADKTFDTPTALGNYLKEISKTSKNNKVINAIVYIVIGLIIGFIASKYLLIIL